jgi:hypothetical protein
MLTRELIALVATGVTFLPGAVSYFTLFAVHETIVGQTALASDSSRRKIFATRQLSLTEIPLV